MGLQPPKSPKLVFFHIHLPKSVAPLSNYFFTKFGLVEGVPGPHPHTKFHRSALKIWAYSRKNGDKSQFLVYIFAPMEKFWGSTEKVEYRCTTTNLPACNDTIVVLIRILLHSVSVTKNFVIPKRDKQTKNITFFRLQPARDPQSPPYLAW